MCLALVALRTHPHYPLVVAANRDEFHRRPAAAAGWWPEGWLAGRDLQAGGTWLGVTPAGRWALVTNVREPGRHDPRAPSRGTLVPRFLAHDGDAASGVAAAVDSAAAGNGFNLIGGVGATAVWGSNRAPEPRTLVPGIHGLSNAQLDTPWPKLRRSTAAVQQWCASGDDSLDTLLALLDDRERAPNDELPATGIPVEWERRLSAPFIVGDDYGTRCSTVFALDHDRTLEFVERSFATDGTPTGDVRLRFRLQQR
ncbi:MAG: NRDE family protein [Betaproteobacteria bacterium]|nr:NRDE family protein [Betaproteobacteria bacterium]